MSVDWAQVYGATFPALVRFLHRKVWDVERARDLAQEAFVRALREEPENPRAWLFRVASNLARDEARTVLRRRRHLTLMAGGGEERAAPDDPHEELVDAERRHGLRRALEQLGERDRNTLLLWDAGLDYREIAERTGLSPGAVGTTLARARKRLVAAYNKEEANHVARG
jgi:RNA polymerase sigma factor (sigma-70 family)